MRAARCLRAALAPGAGATPVIESVALVMITEVSAAEQAAAQEFGHIDGRGVESEAALGFAAALHPVNMILGAWLRNIVDLLAQLRQPPVAFHQFLADLLVLA